MQENEQFFFILTLILENILNLIQKLPDIMLCVLPIIIVITLAARIRQEITSNSSKSEGSNHLPACSLKIYFWQLKSYNFARNKKFQFSQPWEGRKGRRGGWRGIIHPQTLK